MSKAKSGSGTCEHCGHSIYFHSAMVGRRSGEVSDVRCGFCACNQMPGELADQARRLHAIVQGYDEADAQEPDFSMFSPERVARSREQLAAGEYVGLEALDADFEPARIGSCADCGLDLYEGDGDEQGLCDGCSWVSCGGDIKDLPARRGPPEWVGWLGLILAGLAFAGVIRLWWVLVAAAEGL